MYTRVYITVSLFRLFAKSEQQDLYFCIQIIFSLNYIECLEDSMFFVLHDLPCYEWQRCHFFNKLLTYHTVDCVLAMYAREYNFLVATCI